MWPNPRFTADLVTFTIEILNGKLHFLRSKITQSILCNKYSLHISNFEIAWADSVSQLTFLKDFKDSLIQLLQFFGSLPKMFDIYAKNVVKMRHLGFLTKNKHKEVARKVEKTISTRWPGLHVAVDGVYNKALLETINVLVEDRGSRDSMAK